MEENLLSPDPVEQNGGVCVCKGGPTLNILKDVQRAYEERIELLNKVGGKNKTQKELELLRSWVGDLVEQNGLLARAVEEMETEVSSRIMLERRRNSEVVAELRAELAALRRRLARKDSDVRGLLELLRRLREYDHRDIHDIRFYEVTERDIFGCSGQTDMENDDKQSEKQDQNQKDKDFQNVTFI
ncbi:uncharacterized protein [Battus philenor]|uniref:uncharacterized protein n=1 Tax=Battus philenor TaxID=42288 RepID=UPI0035CFB458